MEIDHIFDLIANFDIVYLFSPKSAGQYIYSSLKFGLFVKSSKNGN